MDGFQCLTLSAVAVFKFCAVAKLNFIFEYEGVLTSVAYVVCAKHAGADILKIW